MADGNETSVVARLATVRATAEKILAMASESFDDDHVAVSAFEENDGWQVAIHFREPPNETAVRALVALAAGTEAGNALVFERVASTDWVKASLDGLPPVIIGRFFVHGSHDRARVPPNAVGIEIEAALAFGTGHHGTTQGCLLALDRIAKARRTRGRPFPPPERGRATAKRSGGGPASAQAGPSPGSLREPPSPFQGEGKQGHRLNILDIGTGSGVLAIAAARALRTPVLASDIDIRAVRAARENARLNRAGAFITVVHAAGLAADALRRHAPFDLAFANILLEPIRAFAAPMAKLVAPGGRLVLSGLLTHQAQPALAAYLPHGLALEQRIQIGGWTTLVLRKRKH